MKRVVEFDIMKAIGILLVIIGHVTRMYTEEGLIKPMIGSEILADTTEIIYLFHMPLFFFVSGCVLGHQELKKGHLFLNIDFVTKKIKRLIVPYLFFGFLYVAPFLLLLGYRKSFLSYIYSGIILCLDNRHLWFIMSLFTIFLIVYVLNIVLKRFRYRKYYILLFSFIIFYLQYLFPTVLNIRLSAKFIIWFVLGYVFIDKPKLYSAVLSIISPFACLYLFRFYLQDNNWIFTGMSFLVALMIINSIYIISSYSKKLYNTKIIKYLSDNCFPLYLLHPMLIYLFFHITRQYAVNPFILSTSAFVFSILGSMMFIFIIRKSHMTFILGE